VIINAIDTEHPHQIPSTFPHFYSTLVLVLLLLLSDKKVGKSAGLFKKKDKKQK
jgi:hypothetical protein